MTPGELMEILHNLEEKSGYDDSPVEFSILVHSLFSGGHTKVMLKVGDSAVVIAEGRDRIEVMGSGPQGSTAETSQTIHFTETYEAKNCRIVQLDEEDVLP